jgi:mycothiol conjugate amidase Mca
MSDAPGVDPLCLLAVHAHPDDEASKGAGTVAKYAAEGIRGVLVCCTGGEEGEILNPAVDTPEVRANLFAVRIAELQASVDAIGYEALHLLGYRDSGMKDSEPNAHPDNFANAPFDEAVERLVRIIRMERPQVVITYGDDREFYPHPDHLRVHDISGPAFDAAGDPEQFPDAGEPWQPLKLYYTGWSGRRVRALHETYLARGEESPYATWFERGFTEAGDHRFTTFVDVGDFLHHRRAALLAHRTQVDPEGFWMRLPDDVVREVFPWEEFELARTLVDNGVADGDTEDDLFAGLRAAAPSAST